ncbi:hypothetical protein TSUD_103560 [Trifolium subterraneum]|uniref:Reverse transcriptase zinc-binding domain-containing protein n=1 Tax=Trifolium subterraneum TaxID=3900 RepID=A0A2Z6MYR1_TRISU|nr:hypothetical protein TSUD_103560 [Trifolium subterraneum]
MWQQVIRSKYGEEGVEKVIANGINTSFWKDKWVGELPLKERFPRLYAISNKKEASVAILGGGEGGVRGNMSWRRRLFVWEESLVEQFLEVLNGVILTDQDDNWRWKPDSNGIFSVKSTYELVSNLMSDRGRITPEQASAFKFLWKGLAPSKVLGFAWLLLHDRIPTKVNLFRRRILQQVEDQVCVLCGNCVETSVHLFVYCHFATQVWEQIITWLGMVFMLPQSLVSFFSFFAETSGGKKRRQGLIMIWNAVVWALWRQRNRIIFENGTGDLNGVVEEIKVSSWKWWIGRSKSDPCLLYEWNQEPLLCLAR